MNQTFVQMDAFSQDFVTALKRQVPEELEIPESHPLPKWIALLSQNFPLL